MIIHGKGRAMHKEGFIKANTLQGYVPEYKVWNGEQYIVAPVVILVEGVHHGSAGPVFYPLDEFRDFPASWNGRPVTLGHPHVDGEFVSAGHPDILSEFSIGTLFNTRYDVERRGLLSEVWVNISRAQQLAPEILNALKAGGPIEVSTGLWFEESGGPGVWNGEEFGVTARDFRPDHLALLPDSIGACSIEDGCGIRNEENQIQEERMDSKGSKGLMAFLEGFIKSSKSKADEVAVLLEVFATNKPGMMTTIRSLQRQLDAKDRETLNGGWVVHFLEEAFANGTFIMRVTNNGETQLFRGAFTVDNMGNAEIDESSFVEVREERKFIAMEDTTDGEEVEKTNAQEVDNVSEVSSKKQEAVDALIECKDTHFNESHKEALMLMSESMLEGLKANAVEEEEAGEEIADASEPVVEKKEASEEAGGEAVNEDDDPVPTPSGLQEYVDNAPEAIRATLQSAVKDNEAKRTEMVKAVLAAAGNTFTQEQLDSKSTEEITALHSLVSTKEDAPEGNIDLGAPMGRLHYGGKPAALVGNKSEEKGSAPMGRPSINDMKKKSA